MRGECRARLESPRQRLRFPFLDGVDAFPNRNRVLEEPIRLWRQGIDLAELVLYEMGTLDV